MIARPCVPIAAVFAEWDRMKPNIPSARLFNYYDREWVSRHYWTESWRKQLERPFLVMPLDIDGLQESKLRPYRHPPKKPGRPSAHHRKEAARVVDPTKVNACWNVI